MKISDLTAIIVSGGFGTRIKDIESSLPKPLIRLGDYNLLEHNILRLKKVGINNFIISTWYKADQIESYFGDGKIHKVKIRYIQDPEPLGDGGAFRNCYKQINGTAILVNADDIRTNLNLEDMLKFHQDMRAISTSSVAIKEDLYNHGMVELGKNNKITKFLVKPSTNETKTRYAISGLYIMEPEVIDIFPEGYSLTKDVLFDFVKTNRFYGFPVNGLFFNIGTTEIYQGAQEETQELNKLS